MTSKPSSHKNQEPSDTPRDPVTISNGPITDSDSKTVMLAAERGDRIEIQETLQIVDEAPGVPDSLEVLQRVDTYHGPKLLLGATVSRECRNFLLTAPGPNSQLQLWRDLLTSDGKRKGWKEYARVKAVLPPEQPPYDRCTDCGELIRSIEHERAAISGNCNRNRRTSD